MESKRLTYMLVKVGLAISLSVTAYILTHLRFRPVNRKLIKGSDARGELGNSNEKAQDNVEIKKEICSYTKVDSTQEVDGGEVKRVDSISPSLSLANDELLLPEFNDLLSGEMVFPLEEVVPSSKPTQSGGEEKQASTVDPDIMSEEDKHMYDEGISDNAAEIERLKYLVSELQKREENLQGELLEYKHMYDEAISDNDAEIERWKNLVTELQKREENLQGELLEYYGLMEQETSIVELQKRLKLNTVEIEMLNLKINSLETQKKKVEEELEESSLAKKELESARAKIKELQRQMQMESIQTEEQLVMLKQQVTVLQDTEKESSEKKFEIEKKLQTLRELEVEVVELRRANKELQHEKRELMLKLDITETQLASLSKLTETGTIEKAREEVNTLRHANEDLLKQVEGLQNNRFSEVEELVYLRWVNACLRYELRNYQPPPGKLKARDLNKSLSPRSQEKAKQLMLEYAGHDSLALHEKEYTDNDSKSASSHTSTPSESGDFEESSLDSAFTRQTRSKKLSLIHKLKNWRRSKEDSTVSSVGSAGDRKGNEAITGHRSPWHKHSISASSLEFILPRSSSSGASVASLQRHDGPKTKARSKSNNFLETRNIAPIVDSPEKDKFHTSRTTPEMTDSLINAAASFQLMSKSAGGMHWGEHPDFKVRHDLAIQRESDIKEKAEQARTAKFSEKMKTEALTERVIPEKFIETLQMRESQTDSQNGNDHQGKEMEISKMTVKGVQKRASRVAKKPPKPSTSSLTCINASSKASHATRISPPPPPQPPAAPGMTPTPLPPPTDRHLESQGRAGDKVQKVPQVVEFYQSLVKREAQKEISNVASTVSSNISDAGSNMIGEFGDKSAYLVSVKADVETQGDFVQSLATEVRSASYTNIKDVVDFVHWLDEELSFLVDERAVLKHFDWPEGKADALREAAFEYQDLQKLESEVASFVDDPRLSCDTALYRMYSLLESVEKSMYALLRTRDMVVARYKEFNIPIYWLLDSGRVGKIKFACVQLARKYMARVALELDDIANISENEPIREFLLLQGVRFAFRVHQFAGGFDAESMQAFEDLRRRAQEQVREAS